MNTLEAIKTIDIAIEEIQRLRKTVSQSKREWVGLTDEDIANADCVSLDYNLKGEYGVIESTVLEFAKAIEAKLKEKNT